MPFTFKRLEIPHVILATPTVFSDSRGSFVETYKWSEFVNGGVAEIFVQDNQSHSKRHVLRGLHYQLKPMAQGKLVRCIKGSIYDVCVDLRISSPSFRKWIGVELSDKNNNILYVPPAFAHGFVVLSDEADVLYKCTKEYSKEYDRGILWNDPELGIDWGVSSPIVSEKDARNPLLRDAELNFG